MNGIHDLGGMQGFGEVRPTPETLPAFNSDSERRIFGVAMATMVAGWGDADGFRAAIERLPVETYLRECFPVNWLAGLEVQLRERGLLPEGLLEARLRGEHLSVGPRDASRPSAPQIIPRLDETPVLARFRRGDCVRVLNANPPGHTRMPRYLRGHTGVVVDERGIYDFPDALAARTGRRPQPLYTVMFLARSVWGQNAGARDKLSADLFDDYLELA